ncbi:MAG: cyclic nucleotide-binding domain-containing protein [Verrucomicrobiae bacterium]|nr:cyclic nucleotide-binding domain-containing protein [Verrucomicrobiae bacterium]
MRLPEASDADLDCIGAARMRRKQVMTDAPLHADALRVVRVARKIPLLSMIFRRLPPRQQEIVALLKRTPLFADLSLRELIELLPLIHERSYGDGETVMAQGEPGLGLYVLMRGEVEVRQEDARRNDGIARLGPGEVFGDVSFVDGSPRSATVVACRHAELIGLYRTELLDLMERKPHLASKILFSLARQLGIRLRAMLQARTR